MPPPLQPCLRRGISSLLPVFRDTEGTSTPWVIDPSFGEDPWGMGAPCNILQKRQQERVGTKPEGGFSPSQPSQVWFAGFLAGGAWRASEENEEGLSGQGSSCPSGLSLNPGNGQLKCFNVIKHSPAQRQQAADKSEDG